MARPYREIFARPGARAFCAAGVVARLPMSMVGIAIILIVSGQYGSYALAGRVSAALVVTSALTAPQIARLVDQHGQARVMRPAVVVGSAGLATLAVAVATHANPAWLYAGAVLAGCGGNFGALVRARWSCVLAGEPRLVHTAYSLESALDELVFVVGPVLATALATSGLPQLGLLVPLAAVLTGGAWFVAQRHTEPPATARVPGRRGGSVLRMRGVALLLVLFVGMGAIFSATDVSTVAFATEQGHKGAAGLVLAAFALGSMTAGLLYGARHWRTSQARRFATGIVVLALGVCLFLLVGNLVSLAATMFVVGFAISPSIIAGNGLMAQLVPAGRLTEGLTWIATAINVGVSLGAAAAGSRVDAAGSHGGYLLIVGVAAVVVVLTLLAYPGMRRAGRPAAHDEEPAPVAAASS
ncbi:MAG TPA: MFS transporter [Cellulomonas sp.]